MKAAPPRGGGALCSRSYGGRWQPRGLVVTLGPWGDVHWRLGHGAPHLAGWQGLRVWVPTQPWGERSFGSDVWFPGPQSRNKEKENVLLFGVACGGTFLDWGAALEPFEGRQPGKATRSGSTSWTGSLERTLLSPERARRVGAPVSHQQPHLCPRPAPGSALGSPRPSADWLSPLPHTWAPADSILEVHRKDTWSVSRGASVHLSAPGLHWAVWGEVQPDAAWAGAKLWSLNCPGL